MEVLCADIIFFLFFIPISFFFCNFKIVRTTKKDSVAYSVQEASFGAFFLQFNTGIKYITFLINCI